MDEVATRSPRIGGNPVLDLANTVRWRLDPERRDDVLHSMADAVLFAQDVALISGDEAATVLRLARSDGAEAQRELGRIKRLRESTYSALIDGGPIGPIAKAFRAAILCSELESDGERWSWTPPQSLELVRHRIAVAATALTTDSHVGRVRQCDDASCGWIYLDQSPRRNRRWCVSSDCGNRNRVREHYQRQRDAVQNTGSR